MHVDALTATDAARILNVPRQRIAQFVAEGKLQAPLRLSPRVHLYDPADVEDLRRALRSLHPQG